VRNSSTTLGMTNFRLNLRICECENPFSKTSRWQAGRDSEGRIYPDRKQE
jgi:hypothetical protein